MKSIQKIVKEVDHLQTKFMQKYGNAEKTVDLEFELERERLEKLDQNIGAIYKDVQKLDESVKLMAEPLISASGLLSQFFEEDPLKAPTGEKFRNASMTIMHAVKSYLDRQKDLYFNMEEYIGKINSLKKRVQVRDERCLDYDKFKTLMIKYSTKPPKEQGKLLETEKQFEEHKESYKKINSELIVDLRTFQTNRFRDFHQEYKQLINLQKQLFLASTSAFRILVDVSKPSARRSMQIDEKPPTKLPPTPVFKPTIAILPSQTQPTQNPTPTTTTQATTSSTTTTSPSKNTNDVVVKDRKDSGPPVKPPPKPATQGSFLGQQPKATTSTDSAPPAKPPPVPKKPKPSDDDGDEVASVTSFLIPNVAVASTTTTTTTTTTNETGAKSIDELIEEEQIDLSSKPKRQPPPLPTTTTTTTTTTSVESTTTIPEQKEQTEEKTTNNENENKVETNATEQSQSTDSQTKQE